MNQIFFHMTSHKKNHQQKMTKTLETNITSEKGDEKSNSQYLNQNNLSSKKFNNLYLLQYQKYFNKKLVIKYNILPNEYALMKLDNFITAKYCHSLASFKEQLIFNYHEEFLNRFYTIKETTKKIPLFSEFYKSYLKFFCFPTLAELKLNDLIEDMVEKKAKAFYNENFSEKNDKSNEKKINVVIFTNKIRQDISRKYSLNNLTKTTIKNPTNKSSVSLVTIEKIFNELNSENDNEIKPKIINNYSKTKIKKNNNSINKGLKNSVILHKIRKKIKINETLKTKEINNLSNKIKNDTLKATDYDSSGVRKKTKNKISRNIQNKLLENKIQQSYTQRLGTTQKNISSILKINSKINFNKNIYTPIIEPLVPLESQNQRLSSNSKNNSKNPLADKVYKTKEIKNKQYNNNIYKNYCNTINNNNCIMKNNILISNFSNNIFNNNNLKINNTNINNNTNNNINKNNIYNNNNYNYIAHKTISNSNNNSNRNIKKKIKVIKKPSFQKIKEIKKLKSRNVKSSANDDNNSHNLNSIYSTQVKTDNLFKKENISDYYTIKNKNINTISIKLANKKSKPKIKLVKAENKNNINNLNNQQLININTTTNNNNNAKVFNFITARKKNTNYYITTNLQKDNTSSSSSLKNVNLNEKKRYENNNSRKNRVIDSKPNKVNTNSYVMYDSQKIIKNLKVTSRENSKNILNDNKIKISKKVNESPGDVRIIKSIKSYCKK